MNAAQTQQVEDMLGSEEWSRFSIIVIMMKVHGWHLTTTGEVVKDGHVFHTWIDAIEFQLAN